MKLSKLFLSLNVASGQIASYISKAALIGADSDVDINDFFYTPQLAGRSGESDQEKMDSIQRVHDIDTDISNFVENHAESFHMPCVLAEMSTRIDFLSSKLTESATNAFGNGDLGGDAELSEWVLEILDHGFHGVEQILFSLSRLYDDTVSQIGREIHQNGSRSPQVQMSGFISYMRNLQLKGYLLWSVGLSFSNADYNRSLEPIRKFITNSNAQRYSFDESKVYTVIGHPTVGIQHVVFQSFIRVPDFNNEGMNGADLDNEWRINTQSYLSDWEKIEIIPVESGKFKMKSAAHGTYLKALPSDNSYVEQTRDENELGTEWRIERIGVDVTRSYFGDFSGIKTVHGTLWAEGITRSGRHVLTTTSQVSSLTQFSMQQIDDNSVYVISPSGKYLSENAYSSTYDLLDEPTNESVFMIEDLEDNFFALRGFSTAYANTEPGSSSLVTASWEADDNSKLQRVNAPNDAFHIISAFNQYLQLDGPAEANVFLSVNEDGYMSKWEITSDWDDISSMFM